MECVGLLSSFAPSGTVMCWLVLAEALGVSGSEISSSPGYGCLSSENVTLEHKR